VEHRSPLINTGHEECQGARPRNNVQPWLSGQRNQGRQDPLAFADVAALDPGCEAEFAEWPAPYCIAAGGVRGYIFRAKFENPDPR
jgi:hypothetical protein